MKKSLFFTVGAAILILLLAAAVFLSVSPDPFRASGDTTGITAENVIGDISLRRSGNNYTLNSGEALYPGDEIIVGRNAQCEVVAAGKIRATLNRDADVMIPVSSEGGPVLRVAEGAVFFDMVSGTSDGETVIATDYAVLSPQSGAVFSVEAYTGTQTVNLYEGRSDLTYDGRTFTANAGEHVTMFQSEEELFSSVTAIPASELRQFLLEELIDRGGLCFDTADLRAIIDGRTADTQAVALSDAGERMTCTVEIRCDTALSQPKKPAELPANGVLLPAVPVKFTQGESAYDVLRRACKAAGIEVEYTYFPMISGYYVTRIGPLAENDFGPSSGWLFKVNGWFPNYGSSKYEVEAGDVIVWAYSCEGGGTDLGREVWSSLD